MAVNATEMDWVGRDDAPVQACDAVVTQTNGRGHVVNLGVVSVPFKQPQGGLKAKNFKVRTLARIYFSPDELKTFIEALLQNVVNRDAIRSQLGLPPCAPIEVPPGTITVGQSAEEGTKAE